MTRRKTRPQPRPELMPKRAGALERKRAAGVVELVRAEARLHRAFTRWSKARAAVRRHELEAAKAFVAEADAAAGAPFDDAIPVT